MAESFVYQVDPRSGNVTFNHPPPDPETARSIMRDARRGRPANTGDVEDVCQRLDRIIALLEKLVPTA